ncbi:MAG: M23 family metallopeptidase [Bacteroidota bacterium]
MELIELQVKEVEAFLQGLGPLRADKREELLDHLCCDIEYAMRQGLGFDEAFNHCQGRWNENEVKKIHSSTRNTSIMVKLLTVVILGLGSITFLSLPLTEEQEALAIPMEESGCLLLEPPGQAPLSESYDVSSAFGMRLHPLTKKRLMHRGVDWKAPSGTPVKAAGTGVVLEAGNKGKYGKCVIIVHDEIYQTLYAHLGAIDVALNEKVEAGQIIGKVGSTGQSVGPHLHYEVLKNGVAVNPADYLP